MTDPIPADDLPEPDHQTPDGVTDATIDALGKLSAALETAEQACGTCTPSTSSAGRRT